MGFGDQQKKAGISRNQPASAVSVISKKWLESAGTSRHQLCTFQI